MHARPSPFPAAGVRSTEAGGEDALPTVLMCSSRGGHSPALDPLPQVYDSLKQGAGVAEEVLDHFSRQGGQHLLYELRFLSVQRRAAPAMYIAENGLDQRVRLATTHPEMCCTGATIYIGQSGLEQRVRSSSTA